MCMKRKLKKLTLQMTSILLKSDFCKEKNYLMEKSKKYRVNNNKISYKIP